MNEELKLKIAEIINDYLNTIVGIDSQLHAVDNNGMALDRLVVRTDGKAVLIHMT
jgi:hypothetical protein